MGEIARWTTPTLWYKPKEAEISEIVAVYAVISQIGRPVIQKSIEEAIIVDGGFLWRFTQEEMGILTQHITGKIKIDYKTNTGDRFTTRAFEYAISGSAVDGVI